ncbi:hypothetical protein DN604_12230 [Aeromonas caviae]|nr:hypothetical protein DN604_12230 [Aeromonas caviae]
MDAQEWNIVILIFIVMFLVNLEYFFPGVYTGPWVFVKQLEIKFILLFSGVLNEEYERSLRYILSRLEVIDAGSISFDSITRVEAETRTFMSIVYGAVGIICAAKLFFRPSFDKPLDLEELIDLQTKRVWRFNRHLAKTNPLRHSLDIRVGPYRIRQRPAIYCREHGLIKPIDEYELKKGMRFDREEADIVFSKQVDRVFTKFTDLPQHLQYVAAGLICFICEGMDETVHYFGDVASCEAKEFSRKKLNKRTQEILSKYAGKPEIVAIVQSHKYISGVLRRLLKEGQSFGVVNTALFTWLLYTDRFMYLMLNDHGMPETSVECAYPATHYSEELRVGRRLEDDTMSHYLDELERELRFYNVIK